MDGHYKKVEFTREVPKSDPREIWADGMKWRPLYVLLDRAKAEGADTIVVATPEALGDTWRELVINLTAIAQAGLTLEIEPSTKYAIARSEVAFDGQQEGLKGEMVATFPGPGTPPSGLGTAAHNLAAAAHNLAAAAHKKYGPFKLRAGNKPSLQLTSEGPDESYCQAELLIKVDREGLKPTGKGREIFGSYEITSGTLEWFLYQHADKGSQGLLEDYRSKIMEKGWGAFHLSSYPSSNETGDHIHPEVSTGELRKLGYRLDLANNDVSKKDLKTIKGLMKQIKKDLL